MAAATVPFERSCECFGDTIDPAVRFVEPSATKTGGDAYGYVQFERGTVNFVVLGTEHGMQGSDPGLEALVEAWSKLNYIEPLKAIAEEWHEKGGGCQLRSALPKPTSFAGTTWT